MYMGVDVCVCVCVYAYTERTNNITTLRQIYRFKANPLNYANGFARLKPLRERWHQLEKPLRISPPPRVQYNTNTHTHTHLYSHIYYVPI